MCKLNKFLCCFSLETGGIIIGWINLVLSVVALITLSVLLSLTVIGYYDFDTGANTIIGSFITLVVFYSLFLIYYLIAFFAALWLIQGTTQKNPSKMVLFMIIMLFGVIFQFLQVFTAGLATLISAIFLAAMSLYWFLCIYSLYAKLKSGQISAQPYV